MHILDDLKTVTTWQDIEHIVSNALATSGISLSQIPGALNNYKIANISGIVPGFHRLLMRHGYDIQLIADSDPTFSEAIARDFIQSNPIGSDMNIDKIAEARQTAPNRESINHLVERIFNADSTIEYFYVWDEYLVDSHKEYLESGGLTPVPVLRVEETRENLIINLALSPVDFSVRLGIRIRHNYIFDNPLTRYYLHYYDKDTYEMETSKHHMVFTDHIGSLSYPANRSNRHSFFTVFECLKKQQNVDFWLRKSGQSQMIFTEDLVRHILLFAGSDDLGQTSLLKSRDMCDEPDIYGDNVKFYRMNRTFSSAFADYSIIADITELDLEDDLQDENAEEELFAMLNSSVSPCAGTAASSKTIKLHPPSYQLQS